MLRLLYPAKEPHVPTEHKYGWARSWSENFGLDENLLHVIFITAGMRNLLVLAVPACPYGKDT